MKKVERILFPETDSNFDSMNGFTEIYVRTLKRQSLSIPLEEFIQFVSVGQQGNLAINGHMGYVENGFAFQTVSHIYYGTINEGFITELYLDYFDSMEDETNNLLSRYGLLLGCWCRGSISAA